MSTDTHTENTTEQPPENAVHRARERGHGSGHDGGKVEAGPGTTATSSPLNPLQVISSVLAAGLGVQSSRNRERDFKQGRAVTFIVAGLIFTALFIGGVYTVVSLVLASR